MPVEYKNVVNQIGADMARRQPNRYPQRNPEHEVQVDFDITLLAERTRVAEVEADAGVPIDRRAYGQIFLSADCCDRLDDYWPLGKHVLSACSANIVYVDIHRETRQIEVEQV